MLTHRAGIAIVVTLLKVICAASLGAAAVLVLRNYFQLV